MKKVVGFVPARGGSIRTPGKNLQKVLGVPLFLWAANNLSRCLPKENIYVDSDSDEILALAKKHGFGAIKRPDDLATNATNGNEFMLWEVSNIDADIYVQHLPPMIFLQKDTLSKAIESVVSGEYDSAVGVISEHFYMWENGKPKYDLLNLPNSFTLPLSIIEGMGLYVTTKDSILSQKTRIGKNPALIQLDKFEAIDIDYPSDLELARAVAKGMGFESNYTFGIKQLAEQNKFKPRMVVLDIDGTLTDGGMYYTESGDEFKKFNTKDGLGIKKLIESGIKVGFLSHGKNTKLIQERANHLKVHNVYVGAKPKNEVLNTWCAEYSISISEVAYVGDDINDLSLANEVGLFACPNDALNIVKENSHIVLSKNGGEGCVRELIDLYINTDKI